EVVAAAAAAGRGGGLGIVPLVAGRADPTATAALTAAPTTSAAASGRTATATAATEHLHVIADDYGRIPLGSLLIGPFSRTKAAFDVHLRAFPEVLGSDFAEPAEEHHAVPLG